MYTSAAVFDPVLRFILQSQSSVGISLNSFLWWSRAPETLPTWCSHSRSESGNRVVQSDATTPEVLFISLKHTTPWCKNSAVFLYTTLITQQVNLWLQADCVSLPLPDFQIFPTHSQYSRSQEVLACHREQIPYLCFTQFSRSPQINGAVSLNLASGVCPSIPVILVSETAAFTNLDPVPPGCLYSACSPHPQLEKGWPRFLVFFFLHVPSFMFLSPQSSSTCTLFLGLKYQKVSHCLRTLSNQE